MYSVEVRQGDVIIVGTDGLLDNVFEDEMMAAVTLLKEQGDSGQTVAEGLARLACLNAGLEEGNSPFAKGAREAGMAYSGGKIDDITVMIAFVL